MKQLMQVVEAGLIMVGFFSALTVVVCSSYAASKFVPFLMEVR